MGATLHRYATVLALPRLC